MSQLVTSCLSDGALPKERLSRIGIGCGRAGSLLNAAPLPEIRRTLSAAADAGINVFDTANIYAQGDSERILGRLFGARKDIFVTTKGGMAFSRKALLAAKIKPLLRPVVRMTGVESGVAIARRRAIARDFSQPALLASLEGSLRRLRREYVDGYFLHDPDIKTLNSSEGWEVLRLARRQGKVRFIGASVGTVEEIEAATRIPDCEILQAPLRVVRQVKDSDAYRSFAGRGGCVFVREVRQPSSSLQGEDHADEIRRGMCEAFAMPNLTSVVVGVSRTDHLAQILALI